MKPLSMLPSKSYREAQMVRAIDSGAETEIMQDRNGNYCYHFSPGTETVRDRNGHTPLEYGRFKKCLTCDQIL